MDNGFPLDTMLFRRMDEGEISSALQALQAEEREFRKGEVILHAGNVTRRMGMVLAGSVTIENNDMWGNRTILSHVGEGNFFAETYAWLPDEPMLVDVVANESCRILFLRIGNLRGRMPSAGNWQAKLGENLLTIAVRKNLGLSRRSFHIAPKTIRGRVMSYLNATSLQLGTREFDIPFDRQQLADYLGVERTALSKELGKMQRDGVVAFDRNHFVLRSSAEPF